MSAAPRFPVELGYAGLTMTADEYLALGETPERYELIHGVVCTTPSPGAKHGAIAAELVRQLGNFGARPFADIDVPISATSVYQPDVCAYRAGRVRGHVQRLPPAPDLVVEILSPSNKALDLITKRADYERAGVGEYWVVDPDTLRFRCWRRAGAGMTEVAVAPDADRLPCESLPGFVLDLRAIRVLFDEA